MRKSPTGTVWLWDVRLNVREKGLGSEHMEFIFAAIEKSSYKRKQGWQEDEFTGLFWMDSNIVFCYVSLASMVEKSKLFLEYLLKKTLKKKIPEGKSISSPFSFSVLSNSKYIVKGEETDSCKHLTFTTATLLITWRVSC